MSKTCRDLRAFYWGKFSWTEMICVKKLTLCNSDSDEGKTTTKTLESQKYVFKKLPSISGPQKAIGNIWHLWDLVGCEVWLVDSDVPCGWRIAIIDSGAEEGTLGVEHVRHQDHSKIFPASTRLGVRGALFGADQKQGFGRFWKGIIKKQDFFITDWREDKNRNVFKRLWRRSKPGV